jgi:hypothetical protein
MKPTYGYPPPSTRWDTYDSYKIEPKKQGETSVPAPLALHITCADELSRHLLGTALLISRINELEKGDQGESARIMHKLSIALNKVGEEEESLSMSAEAERIHASLVRTGSYTASDDPVKKWDYLVCLKLR